MKSPTYIVEWGRIYRRAFTVQADANAFFQHKRDDERCDITHVSIIPAGDSGRRTLRLGGARRADPGWESTP